MQREVQIVLNDRDATDGASLRLKRIFGDQIAVFSKEARLQISANVDTAVLGLLVNHTTWAICGFSAQEIDRGIRDNHAGVLNR